MINRKASWLESGGSASRPPGFTAILPSHVRGKVKIKNKSRSGALRAAPAHGLAPLVGARGRGRYAGRPARPAQIRTCGITAYGSSLGFGRQNERQDRHEECVDGESTG